MMEHYGSDFNATGSVMSRGELEEQRRKRGECVRCGQKCFQKKLFKMIPITEHGKVENGRCLNCNPLDASASGAIPAVSRPATEADLKRFSRSQNVLRGGSAHSAGRGAAPNGGMEQRRAVSQNNVATEAAQAARRQSSTRRTSSSNAGAMRSSARSLSSSRSVSSDSPGYHRGDRSMDGDASVGSVPSTTVRGGYDPHVARRPSENLQSMPMNEGHVDNRVMDMPPQPSAGGPRPGFNNRPNSTRSISASSYYSRASDTSSVGPSHRRLHHDDEGSVDGHDEYGAPRSGYHHDTSPHMNGGDFVNRDSLYRHEQVNDYPSEYPEEDYMGVERAPRRDYVDRSNLDYYQRSTHESRGRESDNDSRHEANNPDVCYDDVGPTGSSHHLVRGSVGSNHESIGSSGHNSYHLRPVYQRNDSMASREYEHRSHSMDHSVASFEDEMGRYGHHSDNEINVISDHNTSGHPSSDNQPRGSNSNSNLYAEESIPGEHFPIMQRLRELSDYSEILNILREYRDVPYILSLGMQVLSNLQLTEEDCQNMAMTGVVQIVLEAMVAFRDLADLQISGCRAMWNASFTTDNQVAFVENGALDVLIVNMTAFAQDLDLQEQALSVLANLGAAEVNLNAIVEKGVVAKITDAMNKHINDANIQIRGCLAVANLASHNSPLKQNILQGGAGSAIVISMVMHPINPELQEKALRALRNLSANCDANRIELTNIGGIDAVVSAMQVHRDVAGVQEAGAWTLSNLAGNADSRVLIGDCGGIDVTIRAMWVHSDSVTVQEWCSRALFTLSLEPHNQSMILDVGGISAIVNAMQAHNDSPAIQEMGCAVLFNLASDQPTKMRIVDEEALDAVVLAMVLHSEDDKVQERACQLLLQLSISENFKAMQASNVGELVKAAGEKFPNSCGEPADRLIRVIEGYISEYAQQSQAS